MMGRGDPQIAKSQQCSRRSNSKGLRRRQAKLTNERRTPRTRPAPQSAIGMVKTSEQRKIKLHTRDGEKFWPETYTADRVDKKSFVEFLGEVETYPSVQAPGLLARPMLERAAAFRDQAIVTSDVEACEVVHGNLFDWNLKEVSEFLDAFCTKCAEVAQESSSKQC